VSPSTVDLSTSVGATSLRSAVLTASGTSGHDDELAAYGDLAELGAVVVKSLAAMPWPGNPAPRVAPAGEGMVNAVGLQGPGVAAWRAEGLPRLRSTGATVVASIWGRTTEEFAAAAEALEGAEVAALEVNVSCPNLHDGEAMFAHSPSATASAVAAATRSGLPCWAKLSPTTERVVEVARAAVDAGAAALVLVNTLRGLAVDVDRRERVLGAGSGGLSGAPLHPVALHWVAACRAALPSTPIVGVGGVRSAREVVAFVLAGADAVEVGTATLADPRAPWRVQRDTRRWCARHGVARLLDLKGQLRDAAAVREGSHDERRYDDGAHDDGAHDDGAHDDDLAADDADEHVAVSKEQDHTTDGGTDG
jgi:dihydroorotate dehydrogenase (NAD+) catalytic subunit